MTPTPDSVLPRLPTLTRDPYNIALSLQLLTMYAPPRVQLVARFSTMTKQPIPTLEEFVHALVRLRN